MQHGYLELKLAHELFKKAPGTLSEAEQARLGEVANKHARLEQRILASAAAAQVVVPAPSIATRLEEIRQRYASPDDMAADLERNGLDADKLGAAIERDLRIEAVLDKVASAVAPVTDIDAEIYYRLHPEAFDRPEARRLRHILITFSNPVEKAVARSTLETLRSTGKNSENFSQAALRHSQCPTAMDGGKLGTLKRQQLFPELEPAAFELAVDEVSAVLESPMGLHIVRCDEILPFGMMPFAEACPRIIEKLTEKRRREAQRDWIKEQP